jgi:hypothetical protein
VLQSESVLNGCVFELTFMFNRVLVSGRINELSQNCLVRGTCSPCDTAGASFVMATEQLRCVKTWHHIMNTVR